MLEIKELESKGERNLIQDERFLTSQELTKIIGGQATHIGCQNDQKNPDGQGTTYVGYAPDDVYTPTYSWWDFTWDFPGSDLGDNPGNPSNPTPCPE